MLPSPDTLNNLSHGKFVLANLAAKRAKQLREGALPLVQTSSIHPLTIAFEEIAAGKIKPIFNATPTPLPEAEVSVLIDETRPAELGLLLPSLDDVEAALVTSGVFEAGEEHEAEDAIEVGEEGVLNLSDLIEEEEEEVVAAGDEDTLSLSDIADQENIDEEESHD